MTEIITVSTITEYVQHICQLNSIVRKNEHLQPYELLFRGQSNKDYELIPSLARNRRSSVHCTIFNEERNLIEMAKYKMPEVFTNDLLPIELLALLQHHGVPTRLLDISENALVALYFACCSRPDADGEVIVFRHNNTDIANYPVVNAIADSCRFARGTWTHLSEFFGAAKNQPYFLEQKRTHEVIHETNEAGGRWIEYCCRDIMYIYAPIRSLRQRIQQGRYILFPNRISHEIYDDEGCFEWMIEALPKDHSDIAMRIIIPKEAKQQLLSDLSILGIAEDVLFGDNIERSCKGIVDMFNRRCK